MGGTVFLFCHVQSMVLQRWLAKESRTAEVPEDLMLPEKLPAPVDNVEVLPSVGDNVPKDNESLKISHPAELPCWSDFSQKFGPYSRASPIEVASKPGDFSVMAQAQQILDWSLRVAVLFINIWLSAAIARSGEIYIFVMMYFLIVHDCLAFLVKIGHDIPSSFQNDKPTLYGIAVVILCCQWFFHLFFLPIFSLLHFTALFFPFVFKRFNIRWMLFIIFLLYCLTAIVTVPLFTACCGFIYHTDYKYWGYDYAKPYSDLYQLANNYLQAFCIGTMALCNLALIIKLNLLRRKNFSFAQTSIMVSVQAEATATDRTGRSDQPARIKKRISMGPEARLAISFVLLSGCFFCSTLSFNFLMDTIPLLKMFFGYLNHTKWIIYW